MVSSGSEEDKKCCFQSVKLNLFWRMEIRGKHLMLFRPPKFMVF